MSEKKTENLEQDNNPGQRDVDNARQEARNGQAELNERALAAKEYLKAGGTSGISGKFGKPVFFDSETEKKAAKSAPGMVRGDNVLAQAKPTGADASLPPLTHAQQFEEARARGDYRHMFENAIKAAEDSNKANQNRSDKEALLTDKIRHNLEDSISVMYDASRDPRRTPEQRADARNAAEEAAERLNRSLKDLKKTQEHTDDPSQYHELDNRRSLVDALKGAADDIARTEDSDIIADGGSRNAKGYRVVKMLDGSIKIEDKNHNIINPDKRSLPESKPGDVDTFDDKTGTLVRTRADGTVDRYAADGRRQHTSADGKHSEIDYPDHSKVIFDKDDKGGVTRTTISPTGEREVRTPDGNVEKFDRDGRPLTGGSGDGSSESGDNLKQQESPADAQLRQVWEREMANMKGVMENPRVSAMQKEAIRHIYETMQREGFQGYKAHLTETQDQQEQWGTDSRWHDYFVKVILRH